METPVRELLCIIYLEIARIQIIYKNYEIIIKKRRQNQCNQSDYELQELILKTNLRRQ